MTLSSPSDGQHPLDVGRVGAGRADDEDAAGLEAAAVGVEQVGRAVQRDDGLAGAGAAGDLGDAAGAGPDRLVLVGLDRRDDVAHPLAAAAGQGRHERAVADDDEVVGRLGDHEVVLDADDGRAAAAQDAAAQHAHRLGRGRAVEGGGGRGAPVDDERLVVVVADAEAADVADLAVARRAPPALPSRRTAVRWSVAVGVARPACRGTRASRGRCRGGRRRGPRTGCRARCAAWRRGTSARRARRGRPPRRRRPRPDRPNWLRARPSAWTLSARRPAFSSSSWTRSTCACSTAISRASSSGMLLVDTGEASREPGALLRWDDAFEVLTDIQGL